VKRNAIRILFSVVFLFGFCLIGPAKPFRARYKHADKNKDGVVTPKEWHMEKNWEQKQRSKVNTWWEKRADTNNDGKVDSTELSNWKNLQRERIDMNQDGEIDAKERRLSWRHAKSKVNTSLEAKYDDNHDGWLEPSEIRDMLNDRYLVIQTNGKAKVDTPLEAEYDANADGIIDIDEAEILREDLDLD